jgi:hypothetical protein
MIAKKSIRVTDKTAIRLVQEHAPKQRRSLANCAAAAIIEALGDLNSNKNTDAEQEKSEGGE